MRFTQGALLFLVALVATGMDQMALAVAKKPSRSPPSGRRTGSSTSSSASRSRPPPPGGSRRPPVSKRKYVEEEENDDYEDYAMDLEDDEVEEEEDVEIDIEVDFDEDDDEEDEDYRPRPRTSSKAKMAPRRGPPPSAASSKKRPSRSAASSPRGSGSSRSRYYEDEEEDYDVRPQRRPSGARKSGPPPRSSRGRGPPPPRRGGRPGGRVVPYTRHPQPPSTFTRGIEALRSSMPDPTSVKEAAMKSLNVARETTSNLSTNLYREVKGLTSSELEQVMLKATRPDDTPVKGKHAERLVGLTYQVSAQFEIYDAVLRKLWAKMAEKDWRTTIKALYILHRFSADGSPQHAQNLKLKLREIRRTQDPKRKGKFFSTKILTNWEIKGEYAKFQAFTERYAHYVLLRAQAFSGMFEEIRDPPAPTAKERKKKTPPKPITATSLKEEHLGSARKLLNDGVACELKNGEECENTAIAVERVAADLLSLTSAVAVALTRALKDDEAMKNGADGELLKKWCEFYSEELLPRTRTMVKKTTPKLDAYGLYLPARQKATLAPDLLQKGLKLDAISATDLPAETAAEEDDSPDQGKDLPANDATSMNETDEATIVAEAVEDEEVEDAEDMEDEYEYEEDEEYYDDEEEEEEL